MIAGRVDQWELFSHRYLRNLLSLLEEKCIVQHNRYRNSSNFELLKCQIDLGGCGSFNRNGEQLQACARCSGFSELIDGFDARRIEKDTNRRLAWYKLSRQLYLFSNHSIETH